MTLNGLIASLRGKRHAYITLPVLERILKIDGPKVQISAFVNGARWAETSVLKLLEHGFIVDPEIEARRRYSGGEG